jgi:hypothetical protein
MERKEFSFISRKWEGKDRQKRMDLEKKPHAVPKKLNTTKMDDVAEHRIPLGVRPSRRYRHKMEAHYLVYLVGPRK